jgi:hypothetical protein
MAELALGVDVGDLAPETWTKGQWSLEWLVCVVGFTTACMAASLAIYKMPAGIFDGHKFAYYTSVVSAGVVGLAEVFAAVTWMSGSAGGEIVRAHRCVLCASLVPLAFVAGLGGVRLFVR